MATIDTPGSDHGLDAYSERVLRQFREWAERLAEPDGALDRELVAVPDTVAFTAALIVAARRVRARPDLLSNTIAQQLFANLLEEFNPDSPSALS